MMTIQKISNFSTPHFDVVPINLISDYSYLLVFKSYTAPSHWLKLEEFFDSSFTGKVVLDRMLHVGNSTDRFIVYEVMNGKVQVVSGENIKLNRKHPIRMMSNDVFRKYPKLISYSILNSNQKKLLLHGLSI